MQNMETLYLRATRFVAALTARQGSGDSIEKTEQANAGAQYTGYPTNFLKSLSGNPQLQIGVFADTALGYLLRLQV